MRSHQLFFLILLFILTLALILITPSLVNSQEILIAQEIMGNSSNLTSKEIIVAETSSDREMVEVIREHADEVTQFVEEGMSAMRGGMMR